MSTNIPEQLKYAKTLRMGQGGRDTAWVGITDHAQAELTELVFVELPGSRQNSICRTALCRSRIRQDRK